MTNGPTAPSCSDSLHAWGQLEQEEGTEPQDTICSLVAARTLYYVLLHPTLPPPNPKHLALLTYYISSSAPGEKEVSRPQYKDDGHLSHITGDICWWLQR